jgi:hypothetical protein
VASTRNAIGTWQFGGFAGEKITQLRKITSAPVADLPPRRFESWSGEIGSHPVQPKIPGLAGDPFGFVVERLIITKVEIVVKLVDRLRVLFIG